MIEIMKNKKAQSYDAPDMTITLSAPHNNKQFGLITLRNDVWKSFGSEYVKIIYDDERKRLYMYGADKRDGYRMYMRSKNPLESKNRYMRVGQKAFVDMIKNLIGDYKIQYDAKTKTYYAEVGR